MSSRDANGCEFTTATRRCDNAFVTQLDDDGQGQGCVDDAVTLPAGAYAIVLSGAFAPVRYRLTRAFTAATPAGGPGGVSDGLGLWLTADNVDASFSASVDEWPDASLSALLVAQANGTKRPELHFDTSMQAAVMRFDGNDDTFRTTKTPFAAADSALTIISVFTPNEFQPNQPFLFSYPGTQDCVDDFELGYATGNGGRHNFGLHQGCSKASVSLSNVQRFVPTIVMTEASDVVNVAFNGVEQVVVDDNGGIDGTYRVGLVPVDIGSRDAQGDGYYQGDIAELIVFHRTLTQAERDAVTDYLTTKYRLAPLATTCNEDGVFDVSEGCDEGSTFANGCGRCVDYSELIESQPGSRLLRPGVPTFGTQTSFDSDVWTFTLGSPANVTVSTQNRAGGPCPFAGLLNDVFVPTVGGCPSITASLAAGTHGFALSGFGPGSHYEINLSVAGGTGCGNGVIDEDEDCDDGGVPFAGCSAQCIESGEPDSLGDPRVASIGLNAIGLSAGSLGEFDSDFWRFTILDDAFVSITVLARNAPVCPTMFSRLHVGGTDNTLPNSGIFGCTDFDGPREAGTWRPSTPTQRSPTRSTSALVRLAPAGTSTSTRASSATRDRRRGRRLSEWLSGRERARLAWAAGLGSARHPAGEHTFAVGH
jgi:hypothetical protein